MSETIKLPVRYVEDDDSGAYLRDGDGNDLDDNTKDEERRAKVGNYIALCINEHDKLVAEVDRLKAENERLWNECKRIYTEYAGSDEQIAQAFINFVNGENK